MNEKNLQNTPLLSQDFFKVLIAFTFILIIIYYVAVFIMPNHILVTAAAFGAYMALNIGANDVANNVGPAVGSKAVSLLGAIVIAAIFESAGALMAGGDVVSTIKKGIIDPSLIQDANTFIWLMMAALLAAALWLNLATAFNAQPHIQLLAVFSGQVLPLVVWA
jgi:PiT family inorganic phosphate transporter